MSEDHLAFNKARYEAALNIGPGQIQLGGTSANDKRTPTAMHILPLKADDEAMVKIMPVSG